MGTFFAQALTATGKSVFKYDVQFVVVKNHQPVTSYSPAVTGYGYSPAVSGYGSCIVTTEM